MEIIFKWVKMLDWVDKDFKVIIMNKFEELKKIMCAELKKSMMIMI